MNLDPVESGVPLRDLDMLLRMGLLLLLRLRSLSLSLLPSIASRSRLLRGPMSPTSSKIWRLGIRGRIISHTRSSVKSSLTNSSMYVNEYPSRRIRFIHISTRTISTHSSPAGAVSCSLLGEVLESRRRRRLERSSVCTLRPKHVDTYEDIGTGGKVCK